MIGRILLFLTICIPFQLPAEDEQPNILVEGDIQVSSSIDEYQTPVSGVPLNGQVMITHYANTEVDPKSFLIGNKPLKVEFVQKVPLVSYSSLLITIYRFQLEGRKPGVYTLDPIKVKVGGKYYQAPPITIQVHSPDGEGNYEKILCSFHYL